LGGEEEAGLGRKRDDAGRGGKEMRHEGEEKR